MNPVYFAIAIFAIFLAFNIFIRFRTFRFFKEMLQHKIQFNFYDVFTRFRWDEVIKTYPQHEELLQTFRKHILKTGILFISVILIVLLLLFYISYYATKS